MKDPNLIPQIRVMQQQEQSPPHKCNDYMSTTSIVTPSHREALCNWGYQTIAACNGISRSTCVTAILYFDRFLSSSSPAVTGALSDPCEFQLAFVTCLVIALKVHPGFIVETDFVSNVVCKNMYHSEEINCMEIEVLRALSWKINGPTAHDFIEYFLEIIPNLEADEKERVIFFSKGLVEFAVTKYAVGIRRPSEVAFTAISYAFQYAGLGSADCLSFLKTLSGLDPLNDPQLASFYGTTNTLILEWISENEHDALDNGHQNDTNSDASSENWSESSPISMARGLP